MRKALVLAAALATLLLLNGCEPPRGSIYLRNNSSGTVTLREPLKSPDDGTPYFFYSVTAEPGTTRSGPIDPQGGCRITWEIVDANGKQLRTIDKICDGQTVRYP